MKEERLILVTNDDGYDSKGLAAAVEVARGFGRGVVGAPETTQRGWRCTPFPARRWTA